MRISAMFHAWRDVWVRYQKAVIVVFQTIHSAIADCDAPATYAPVVLTPKQDTQQKVSLVSSRLFDAV
jgi:hypothetical protein